ncbi:MAG: phosphatase PAP2 family protein [Nocardioidaceae bacterium]
MTDDEPWPDPADGQAGRSARAARVPAPPSVAIDTGPTVASWLRRMSPRFWLGFLMLLGFGWVTLDVLLQGPLVRLDHVVESWTQANAPGVAVTVAHYSGHVGQRLYCVPLMAVLCVLLAWRRRQWRPMLVPLVVMVFLALVVPGMKLWTGRTNPYSGVDLMYAGGTEYPSGHEINAIVVWGMTWALATCFTWPVGRWLTRRRQAVLTTISTLIVTWSVLVARTHWLSDVIAGVLMAVPLLWLVHWYGFVKAPSETSAAGAQQRDG